MYPQLYFASLWPTTNFATFRIVSYDQYKWATMDCTVQSKAFCKCQVFVLTYTFAPISAIQQSLKSTARTASCSIIAQCRNNRHTVSSFEMACCTAHFSLGGMFIKSFNYSVTKLRTPINAESTRYLTFFVHLHAGLGSMHSWHYVHETKINWQNAS